VRDRKRRADAQRMLRIPLDSWSHVIERARTGTVRQRWPKILSFDPDALRRKYREERDKRLRARHEHTVEVTDGFAHLCRRSLVEPFDREPLTDAVDVVIVGGGFGGLLAGARRARPASRHPCDREGRRLRRHVYWNRYPGAMCDVESYVYLPLLEEESLTYDEKYAHAAEILTTARPSRKALRPVRERLLPNGKSRACGGTTTALGGSSHQPRRRHAGAVRVHGPTARCKPPRLPWQRRHQRPSQSRIVYHSEPLGLRVHTATLDCRGCPEASGGATGRWPCTRTAPAWRRRGWWR